MCANIKIYFNYFPICPNDNLRFCLDALTKWQPVANTLLTKTIFSGCLLGPPAAFPNHSQHPYFSSVPEREAHLNLRLSPYHKMTSWDMILSQLFLHFIFRSLCISVNYWGCWREWTIFLFSAQFPASIFVYFLNDNIN